MTKMKHTPTFFAFMHRAFLEIDDAALEQPSAKTGVHICDCSNCGPMEVLNISFERV